MEVQKIKIPAKQGLAMISEMIKLSYLCNYLNRSTGWIYNKMNHAETSTTSAGFNEKDLLGINTALENIGNELLQKRILPIDNPDIDIKIRKEDTARQLKEVSSIISMPYIYVNKLGKNNIWYAKRIANASRYKFSDKDILTINMAIIEIGSKLLSIELTLVE
nr:MAG TPA_asm: protein of unknown function (DUF5053) [Caudoviricetes sp.]